MRRPFCAALSLSPSLPPPHPPSPPLPPSLSLALSLPLSLPLSPSLSIFLSLPLPLPHSGRMHCVFVLERAWGRRAFVSVRARVRVYPRGAAAGGRERKRERELRTMRCASHGSNASPLARCFASRNAYTLYTHTKYLYLHVLYIII